MELTPRRKTDTASRTSFLGTATKETTEKDSDAEVQFHLLSPAEVQQDKLLNHPCPPLCPILRAKENQE